MADKGSSSKHGQKSPQKSGQKSPLFKATQSLASKLSFASMAAATSDDKALTFPPLEKGDTYAWAREVTKLVEKAVEQIEADAQVRRQELKEKADPWNRARNIMTTHIHNELDFHFKFFIESLAKGIDCHTYFKIPGDAPIWTPKLKLLANLGRSQLLKDPKLMGTLTPAEFEVWKMAQPGMYWYFRVTLMKCNILGTDWLGIIRVVQGKEEIVFPSSEKLQDPKQ